MEVSWKYTNYNLYRNYRGLLSESSFKKGSAVSY